MSTLLWYAVYTRPKWEKKVADLLTKKKVENYCPLNKVARQWSDRKKIVLEPLFTSYVFVHLRESEFSHALETDGIINIVYWLKKPAVIRDNEIEVIKQFLGEHENVQLEKSTVNVNDRVRVLSGPLMSSEGNILEVYHKTVKILLPSLGYNMVAELKKDNLEKVITTSRSLNAV